MNTFYFLEGNIFETERGALDYKQYRGLHGTPHPIRTAKSFNDFECGYLAARITGDSCQDAIERAR